jgi:hypothetical protein
MRRFAARRWRNTGAFITASIITLLVYIGYTVFLRDTSFISGWGLLLCIIALAAFNVRKKLPVLNLGSASSWFQIHLYLGLWSVVLFSAHLDFKIPNGRLETILAALYVLIAASGIAGVLLSRAFAPALTRHGESVIFERIPALRAALHTKAEKLVLQALQQANSETIAEFYSRKLMRFLAGPRNLPAHVIGSDHALHALLSQINVMRPYMIDKELKIMDQLADIVRAKDQLDYQYARQGLLKLWLFFHIPLSGALLMIGVLHLTIVYTFIGAVQ